MLRALLTPVMHANALRPHARLGTIRTRLSFCFIPGQQPVLGAVRYSSNSVPTNKLSPSSPRFLRAQLNYKAHRSGRSCSCGSHLSSSWHIDRENDGLLCQSCYCRRKAARGTSGANSCLDCGTKTCSAWYIHPRTGTLSRCRPCYVRYKREQHELAGTICRDCGTTESGRWLPDWSRDGSFRCQTCHENERTKRFPAHGRSCTECGTQTTSRWHRHDHPNSNDAFKCKSCYYRHANSTKREADNAGKKETLEHLCEAVHTDSGESEVS
ncbi:hypothetical protein PENSPDRAFT_461812 [Peniophora sp. CONT]|nr:hypothetical protein PENSPDRAFT_461812 [Peniophora sp. CONT]